VRGRMAVQYARTLAFSALAEQQGLAKNPAIAKELDAQLKLARARFLANVFLQSLQKPLIPTTESEIQKYYETHKERYEQVQVRRLSVPTAVPTENHRPLDSAAVKTEMEELHKRALAGEDFNQLQQDAYNHLHIQATPPPVNLVTLRRGNMQGDEAKVFDLKPGEITAVLDLPAAFVIMKLESKDPVQMESVRQDIEAGLRADRMNIELKKIAKPITTQFDLEYLQLAAQPDIFGSATVTPIPTRSKLRASRSPMRK